MIRGGYFRSNRVGGFCLGICRGGGMLDVCDRFWCLFMYLDEQAMLTKCCVHDRETTCIIYLPESEVRYLTRWRHITQ
jgi:hypothetical protein